MSNVKAGDLAILVRPTHPEMSHLVGRIYRIVGRCEHGYSSVSWKYEGAQEKGGSPSMRWRVCCFSDRDLRPIRDPGDDAVDETLVWAGKPQKTTEPA